MTISEHERLLEDARNQGRHEGITVVLGEIEKALDHDANMRVWFNAVRALYEETREPTVSEMERDRSDWLSMMREKFEAGTFDPFGIS